MKQIKSKKIFLVRHTSLAIEPQICYGRSDIDVTENFLQEAEQVSKKLAKEGLEDAKFFSSPLTRTKKLAEYLAEKNNVEEIEFSKEIIEIDFGNWEMKKWDEIDPEQIGRFFRNIVEQAPASGESFNDVVERTRLFWQKIIQLPYEKIVVVTHGGVLKAFMSTIARTDAHTASGFIFDYGAIVAVEYIEGVNRILYVNR